MATALFALLKMALSMHGFVLFISIHILRFFSSSVKNGTNIFIATALSM